MGGCAPVGSSAPETPAGPPPLVLETGQPSEADEIRARTLVADARAALVLRRHDDALRAARTVVDELPATRVSGEALRIMVSAAVAAADWVTAEEAAGRLADALPDDDDERREVLEVRARALTELGDPLGALDQLIAAGDQGPLSSDAAALARSIASDAPLDALTERVERLTPGHPLAPSLLLQQALALRLAGDTERAREAAEAALGAGLAGPDAETAGALAQGQAPPGVESVRIAALLPLSGSPALRTFAAGVREGVEAAITAHGLEGVVELEVLDTGGDPSTAEMLVRSAEESGVVGIVGPLQTEELGSAARARTRSVPLVSPTAFVLPDQAAGDVYSLGAADPGAPAMLADWAIGVGIREVAVVHPSVGTAADEARIFQARFQERGGRVVRTFTYQPGATYFQEPLRAVHQLRPEALFLPAPPDDVQALAPQLSFFGLDTLGVQLMGSAAWADPAVAAAVGRRHLDGVVAVTPRLPGEAGAGRRAFVDAFERRFQRSLVDPVAPSLGHDAASLLLRAVRSGARTADAVRAALEGVDGFEGATGVLSIEQGRVVREHGVVCLWDGQARALASNQRPEPLFRPHVRDPVTGELPEGPGRRAGFQCPGVDTLPPGGGA